VIERALDVFENMLVQQNGDMVYHRGPLSRWGSIFNAVVSGILFVSGVVAIVTRFEPFFVMFVVIGATLHTFFVLIAIRVHRGRTLFDRELTAEIEAEERAQNGESA